MVNEAEDPKKQIRSQKQLRRMFQNSKKGTKIPQPVKKSRNYSISNENEKNIEDTQQIRRMNVAKKSFDKAESRNE